MKKIKRSIPGIIITAVLVLFIVLFMDLLSGTNLIPTKFLVMAGVVFVLYTAAVLILTWNAKHLGRFVFGFILTVLMMVLVMVGSNYIVKGVNTLAGITQTTVEIADVGVYVKRDDPAAQMSDITDYNFGILESLDRDNTDKAIDEIEKELGTKLQITEYPGLAELVDSILTTGETQAIILNSAFIELISDMEGYEDADESLREFHVQQVETIIEIVVDRDAENKDGSASAAKDDQVFTMYISGIDSRTGLIAKSRSDVNIIATVNTETRQMLLVSTPRDYYVPLSISNGQEDKLTHAGIYGVDVSVETLEMLYDMDIDYYFRVNFTGFERIIDELGGITVYSEYAFESQNAKGYSFVKGENNLDGSAALAFSRERYAFADGDRQRGKNQMAVIKAVVNKALSPVLLTNFSGIMDSVSGSFETSMPYDVLSGLVKDQLDKGGDWNIVSYSVDGTGASKKPYSLSTNAYVMVPDYSTVETAISMMNQVKAGEILSSD